MANKKYYKSKNKSVSFSLEDYRRLIIDDFCRNTKVLETGFIGHINLKDVGKYLRDPKYYWREILKISKSLMHFSPHYYQLNRLFGNMFLFDWGIDIYDVKSNSNIEAVRKNYLNIINRFETMNIAHEFSKIASVLPYQDIYCGMIVENVEDSSDFFFQEVPFGICKLYRIQDGLYNFRIDLSRIESSKICAYPDYVREEYDLYTQGNREYGMWYDPPADKQICIKLNWEWTYPFPFLIGVVRDILDLDVYKKLKLQSARTDNYKAIMSKVPIDTTKVDKPLVSLDVLRACTEINKGALPDDVGVYYTLGSDGQSINFKNSNNTTNNVTDGTDALYDSSGVTRELFNGSSSGTAVTFSVEANSGFIYGVYRQFERWANRFIKIRKYNKNAYKFRFYLLDITIFNKEKVSKQYKEACTLGAPVIDKWMASLGMTPSRVMGSYILHEDIFDYNNKFKPLSSSYNSSVSASEAGRPTNEEKGELLSDEGEKTADGEKNDL